MTYGSCFVYRAADRCAQCARGACLIPNPVDLNKEAVELAARIQGNFEELGV